ncbi:MAG TPA: AIM24 family protein [Solirubrobacteraceae bacterium]
MSIQTNLQQYVETESADAFSLQNSKLLKVELHDGEIQAKKGSMVAYQGDVSFEHAGSGGMGRMLKKAMSGEGTTLMKIGGTGEIFLADSAQEIHLLKLDNDSVTVNGPNLLAFDADIDWDINRISGGTASAMSGGLFNMTLKGSGWVALLTDGPPILLDVASAPTFADAQAAVTWSSGVSANLKTDFKAKNLIGKSSGETLQMAFSGQGWVLVQPSEGRPVPTSGGGSGGLIGNVLGG